MADSKEARPIFAVTYEPEREDACINALLDRIPSYWMRRGVEPFATIGVDAFFWGSDLIQVSLPRRAKMRTGSSKRLLDIDLQDEWREEEDGHRQKSYILSLPKELRILPSGLFQLAERFRTVLSELAAVATEDFGLTVPSLATSGTILLLLAWPFGAKAAVGHLIKLSSTGGGAHWASQYILTACTAANTLGAIYFSAEATSNGVHKTAAATCIISFIATAGITIFSHNHMEPAVRHIISVAFPGLASFLHHVTKPGGIKMAVLCLQSAISAPLIISNIAYMSGKSLKDAQSTLIYFLTADALAMNAYLGCPIAFGTWGVPLSFGAEAGFICLAINRLWMLPMWAADVGIKNRKRVSVAVDLCTFTWAILPILTGSFLTGACGEEAAVGTYLVIDVLNKCATQQLLLRSPEAIKAADNTYRRRQEFTFTD
eukprot:TRINITY_DN109210_c0_g1_i1.p1 TRINITY_DN109210_c0_g1~~TRINITY_DN109210_c0_g1_i1.p1  ORF type:complete len:431 (-),score=39.55 TRINITY_DN109210_c0_g1_i1:389-1681(-)